MAEHYVIIGNGPAANTAATTLREQSPKARVTMIGSGRGGYFRPDLLPRYVAGKIEEQALYVHHHTHYKKLDIKLRLGQEVVKIDFTNKELALDHKEVIGYDGLIIATGSTPRIPEPLLAFQHLFLTLKTVEDANLWREKLSHVDTVALAGGDLTSVNFTWELLDLGKKVVFVLDDTCFWPLPCDDPAKTEVMRRFQKRGVQVVDGKKLFGIAEEGDRRYVLDTGAGDIHVGLVGIFFGLHPNVKFLAGSELHVERGILVDETLRTSVEGVYAAGDCAQVYSPKLRDYWVSIGYGNARSLGRVAALNLLGSNVRAETAETSVFDVEGLSVNNTWWTEF